MPPKRGRSYAFASFQLDAEELVLLRDGEPVDVTPKVLDLLILLVENQGHLVSKREIKEKIWPGDKEVTDRNLLFHVAKVREALCEAGGNGNGFIETVPKRGYRFVAPVSQISLAVRDEALAAQNLALSANSGCLGSNGSALNTSTAREKVQQSLPESLPTKRKPVSAVSRQRWFAVASAAAVFAAIGAYLLVRPLPAPALGQVRQLTNDGRGKGSGLEMDGAFFYFTEGTSTEAELKWMSATGGEAAELPLPFSSFDLLDLSPDRSSALLGSPSTDDRPFWVAPLPTGSPHRVGELVGHAARWSPEGGRIAYGRAQELFIASGDGSDARKIAALHGEARWIRWAPDARLLRFTVFDPRSVTNSLWEIGVDGTGLRKLHLNPDTTLDECCGTWTADGKYFLFEVSKNGRPAIWSIRFWGAGLHWKGREPHRLTMLSQDATYPQVSADGKRVFFFGRTPRAELRRYSPTEKQFVSFLGGIAAQWLAYSPDDQQVAYVKIPERTVWVMTKNGTEQRQLTFPPMKAQGLAWSPNGTTIVVNASTTISPFKNYLVSPTGAEGPQELRPGKQDREGIPSWSPDGREIAFGDVPQVYGKGSKQNVIHILDTATGKLETLPHSEGLWTPRWSPDGRYIAAIRDDDPDPYRQRLVLYDCRTRQWQELNADHVNNPTWSHDSRYIYYDGESRLEGIFRVEIPNGKAELVANFGRTERWNSEWSGLTDDDWPLILADAGNEEIFALDVDLP